MGRLAIAAAAVALSTSLAGPAAFTPNFTATTGGGVTVHDLTRPVSSS